MSAMLRCASWIAAAVLLALAAVVHGADPIAIGGMCDRTGSTQNIANELCPGAADYIALVNRKGGVLGHAIRYTEFDHAYDVSRAVDAYERLKKEGVVTVLSYGVPPLRALTPRYMQDRIPAFSTGTGRSDAIDGETWPFIFPGTASYWSQAGAGMQYLKDMGAKKGTRIAFLYYDNPAGREAGPMVDAVAAKEGYVVRKYAVPPPGIEMQAQVTDIVDGFKADWVLASLFGDAPAVSIAQFKRAGYPMNRVLSFVFGAGEPNIDAAGWDVAQGYLGMQYASVGRNFPVIQDILAMYREQGREVPRHVGGAYYNRGVLNGAVIVEAVRLAIRNHGLPLDGDKVRRGYEAVKDFDLGGLISPITLTPKDHEGGGYIRIYQVKGNAWVPVTGWIRGYREEVMTLVREANRK